MSFSDFAGSHSVFLSSSRILGLDDTTTVDARVIDMYMYVVVDCNDDSRRWRGERPGEGCARRGPFSGGGRAMTNERLSARSSGTLDVHVRR